LPYIKENYFTSQQSQQMFLEIFSFVDLKVHDTQLTTIPNSKVVRSCTIIENKYGAKFWEISGAT